MESCRRTTSIGTRLGYAEESGEIESIARVAAGYGKVAAIERNLERRSGSRATA